MIRLQDGRRVQWKDGERHYVGAVIVWSDTGEDVQVAYGCVMVRVHPSGELASVMSASAAPVDALGALSVSATTSESAERL